MAMSDTREQTVLVEILAAAGLTVNGGQDYDPQIHHKDTSKRILARGSLGAGESYMDGWWDCKELDEFYNRLLRAQLDVNFKTAAMAVNIMRAKLVNLQNKERSKKVALQHYDLGNHLYEKMLDKRMQYTCAYWKHASNLDEAQERKLEMICKKIQLKSTDQVLELGCGFGGFAKYAAENYGCHVSAYNISQKQVAWGREQCKGLPVEFHLEDYRDALGQYDKVVAIGLFEHIGHKNYRKFYEMVHKRLKDDGLALIHTIARSKSMLTADAWLNKYIFPGSLIPGPAQMAEGFDELLTMEDWHNFGPDYDRTLMAWWENFDSKWDSIKSDKYDERFYRMWKYYLLMCAGSFRSRKNQLWQIVFSKNGVRGGYESIR
jgi:cyclopropane-fatty-acyl-phospholipid synthase